MNGKFLELDVVDLVIPSNEIDVESPKTISLPLPIPVVSVSSFVSIKTGVQIIPIETRVLIFQLRP